MGADIRLLCVAASTGADARMPRSKGRFGAALDAAPVPSRRPDKREIIKLAVMRSPREGPYESSRRNFFPSPASRALRPSVLSASHSCC